MKKKAFMGMGIIAVIILTLFYYNKNKGDSAAEANLSLKKLKNFDFHSVENSYLIVHFWAKWCEPCLEEIPALVKFAASVEGKFAKPLKILAISLDPTLEESKSILPNRGQGLPAPFILVSDPEHEVAEAMGSFQYPETYFVDPQGKIIEKWIGPQKWDKPEVLQYFEKSIH